MDLLLYQIRRNCILLLSVLCLILQFQLTVVGINSQLPAVEIQWTYQTNNPIFSSPVVADLTNDGKLEILFSSMGNTFTLDSNGKLIWNNTDIKFAYSAGAIANPAIVDIDGSNTLEIVVDSYSYGVYCINRFGDVMWFYEEDAIVTSPVIADLDNNGDMEIIFATQQRILCLNSSGLVKWNYTVEVAYSFGTQFALADLDDSGDVEILINTQSSELLCLNTDGTKAWSSNYSGMPITADLDGDNSKEIILSSYDQVTCLNSTGGFLWEYIGGSDFTVISVANIIEDEKLEVIVCSGAGKSVICLNSLGQWEWTYFADETPTSLCIADLTGDGNLEIIIGTEYGGLFCLSANKALLWEISVSDEFWAVTYPCIIDLNGDGIHEIVFAHFKTVYCLKVTGISKSGVAPWYCKGGTVFRTGTLDSDGDYIDDLSEETWLQTDRLVADSDFDYLTDGEEFLYYHTDPTNPDTDGDGFLDGEEIASGTDPLNPDDNPAIRRRLLIKKVLIIVIPIMAILSFLLIVSKISYVLKHPKSILSRTIAQLKNSDNEFVPLKELINKTNLTRDKILKQLKKNSFCENNNIIFFSNCLYFKEKIDLKAMITNLEKASVEIQGKEIINNDTILLLSEGKEQLEKVKFFAEELKNQEIINKCHKISHDLTDFMNKIYFDILARVNG